MELRSECVVVSSVSKTMEGKGTSQKCVSQTTGSIFPILQEPANWADLKGHCHQSYHTIHHWTGHRSTWHRSVDIGTCGWNRLNPLNRITRAALSSLIFTSLHLLSHLLITFKLTVKLHTLAFTLAIFSTLLALLTQSNSHLNCLPSIDCCFLHSTSVCTDC